MIFDGFVHSLPDIDPAETKEWLESLDSVVNAQGCSLDQLVPCAGPAAGGTWANHGQYVSTFTQTVTQFVAQGLISRKEKGHLTSQAARSTCGKGNPPGGSNGGNGGNGGGKGHGHGH